MSRFCCRSASWPLPLALALVTLLATALGPEVVAAEHLSPGLHDIVVYDPGAHEIGLPKVRFRPDGQVDIPPAVHVHRFYYSGNKEIQGPLVAGGPTVVVANHPKTGERMYVEAMLPAGNPRIAYTKAAITYVYQDKRVAIRFHHFPFRTDRVTVHYHGGQGVGRAVEGHWSKIKQHTSQSWHDNAVVQSLKKTTSGVSDAVHGLAENAGKSTSGLLDKVGELSAIIPGFSNLQSQGQQRFERRNSTRIEGAAQTARRKEDIFVPTLR